MKKIQTQLKSVSKTLAGLAQKIEKLNAQLAKAPAAKKAAPAKKKAAAPKKKAAAKKKAPAKKKVAAKKKPAAKAKDKATVLDSVMAVINKSRSGATIANLKAKTGLESRQLSNALYKLSKKGMIKSKSRGVYVKA
jgi:predicted Rossmann fold nucleotide-binding protein DprA/Smf involved in DNA uptake